MIQKFEFKETEIPGLIQVIPFNADDIRGCFTKDYSKEIFEENGIVQFGKNPKHTEATTLQQKIHIWQKEKGIRK